MTRAATTCWGAAFLLSTLGVALQAHAQCVADTDCKGDRRCVAGACQDRGAPCAKDKDCPGDQICTDGACAMPGQPAGTAPAPTAPAPTSPTSATTAPPPGAVPSGAPPGASPSAPVGSGPQPFGLPPAQPTATTTTTEGIPGLYIPGIIALGVGYVGAIASSAAGAASFEEGRAMLGDGNRAVLSVGPTSVGSGMGLGITLRGADAL